MSSVLNLTQYMKQAYTKKAIFIYRGTAALKKGRGMCFNLDYATTATGETAADNFGGRGLKEIQRPDNTNNMAFAGVLTQNYAANPNGYPRKVQLALPGSCAFVSARSALTIIGNRIACNVGGADPGVFAFAGHSGLGSALPLRTEAEADGGDIAHINTAGTATAVYSSSTGLTTITSTGAGDAVGYSDSDNITATDFECTVFGGADNAAGGDASIGELASKAVYPVVASTSANAFTVTGDTGDCDLTITITKKELLVLAYLDDGPESGCLEVISPQDAVAVQSMVGGVTLACGGYTMAADSTSILADGIVEGQMKSFGGLGTLTTKGYKVTVTSGVQEDHSSAIATVLIDAAAETIVLKWLGNIGIATGGLWHELHNIGATIA